MTCRVSHPVPCSSNARSPAVWWWCHYTIWCKWSCQSHSLYLNSPSTKCCPAVHSGGKTNGNLIGIKKRTAQTRMRPTQHRSAHLWISVSPLFVRVHVCKCALGHSIRYIFYILIWAMIKKVWKPWTGRLTFSFPFLFPSLPVKCLPQ